MEMLSAVFRNDVHERLYFYVEQQDVDCVRRMLTKGADPTKVVRSGRTAVTQASEMGSLDVLRILLESCEAENKSFASTAGQNMKSELEIQTPDGMEALQWDEEIQGNNAMCDDEWSNLFKYYANVIEQTRDMLVSTIKVRDPHGLDAHHMAPIHYAARGGWLDCVRLLLDYGAPVDTITTNNETPLHFAIKKRDVLDLLLLRGANPNSKKMPSGETPLHLAAATGDSIVADMLLDAGADINRVSDGLGLSPLHAAVIYGQYELAHFLINKGARLNSQDVTGHTALFHAIRLDKVDLARHLLQNGARLLLSHYQIHYCVTNNMLQMAELLIRAGDNLNIRNLSGRTPLFLGIMLGHHEMVDLLMNNGARLGIHDVSTHEYHLACESIDKVDTFRKICRILNKHRISMNARSFGDSVLSKALVLNKSAFVEVLVLEGVTVNYPPDSPHWMFNALNMARRLKNLRIMKFLVYAGLKIHSPLPGNLRKLPVKNIQGDTEDWLSHTARNPFTLKQICRIYIRDHLIQFSESCKRRRNWRPLSMEKMIRLLDIPMELKQYLYAFKDVVLSCEYPE